MIHGGVSIRSMKTILHILSFYNHLTKNYFYVENYLEPWMKMQSSIIVMLLGSANERRLSSRRVRRGTKTGDGHQNYYKKVFLDFQQLPGWSGGICRLETRAQFLFRLTICCWWSGNSKTNHWAKIAIIILDRTITGTFTGIQPSWNTRFRLRNIQTLMHKYALPLNSIFIYHLFRFKLIAFTITWKKLLKQ